MKKMNEAKARAILGFHFNSTLTVHSINTAVREFLSRKRQSFDADKVLQNLEAGIFLIKQIGDGIYIDFSAPITHVVPGEKLSAFKQDFAAMVNKVTGKSKKDVLAKFEKRAPTVRVTPVLHLVY